MKFAYELSGKPRPDSSEARREFIGRAFGSTHDAARALDVAATATHCEHGHFRLDLERVQAVEGEPLPRVEAPLSFLERIARSGRPVELHDMQPNEELVGITVSAGEEDEDGVFVTGRNLEEALQALRAHERFASL